MSDSEDEIDQHQFKVILLGDGAVGKTSIAMRFCNNHFAQQYKQTIGLDFFMKRLTDAGISFSGKDVLDVLIDFSTFTPRNILENEFEKLILFKLYDDKPLSVDDFFDVISIDYEVKELSLAVALAERNIIELEKNLSAFFSYSKSPISILHFVSAYFYKLSLIKLLISSSVIPFFTLYLSV